ncbi:GGDEF domain-containing protein [Thermodesulfobacteriota bacterium]
MAKDKADEIKQLKTDYFELEEIRREERKSLLNVINTFGVLASDKDDMAEDIQSIKGLIIPDGELSIEEIEMELRKIKNKIIAKDSGENHGSDESVQLHYLEERVLEACRIIKRIMAAILDDFYPMTKEMASTADNIGIECKGDITQIEFKKPSEDLLDFIKRVKFKIFEDFKDINTAFFTLLEQVKDLEISLAGEYGGDEPVKEIEYFEMKINQEVGSITESFDIYTTISEVKKVVVDKINNIKDLVSLRKKEEVRKTLIARKSISKLKKKITEVEKVAHNMSKKAKQFQKVAMRDSLTGLYNRNEFNLKVKDTLNIFHKEGERFSIILFDVDKFKVINDSLGHIAGDKVLMKVAECLKESFRSNDFLARYGGDEFVVIIEGLTKEMAQDKIEIFKNNLKKKRFISYKEGEINLTVSAGITMVMEGDTLESLIDRADKAMYALKRKG